MSQQDTIESATVSVRNIGGIGHSDISFRSGVTVLVGRNATNRTSLLTAIRDALGGSAATLKTDADSGEIALELNSEQYSCQYVREGNDLRSDRDTYTDETELVDLYASLSESNPVRRAAERNDDLRELLMRPVDSEEIERRIRETRRERERIAERIKNVDDQRERLPALEERLQGTRRDLEAIADELDEARAAVEDHRANREEAQAAEEVAEELEVSRQQLRRTHERIETQQASVEALYEERSDVRDELDTPTTEDEEQAGIGDDLARLQEDERALADAINESTAIVEFNEDLLDGDRSELLDGESTDRDVTSGLDPQSQHVECWTCGSDVLRREIEDRLAELRDTVDRKRRERQHVRERINTLRERYSELKSAQQRADDLERQLGETEAEIDERGERISRLEDDVEKTREHIDELEYRIEGTEELRDSDLLEQYQRLSELEHEHGRLKRERTNIEDEIAELDRLGDERERLATRQDTLQDTLGSLRTRIEDVEESVVETFNEHMADVLSQLQYENIERTWIERRVSSGDPHNRSAGVSNATFDLHVVRTTANGSVYEDTIDNVSESEREVIGLVTALAGYLAYEAYETVPMMLLDSLEAIDADRIATLVEYFAEYVPYLLVALLPEDAAELDDGYEYVRADSIGS